MNNSTQKDNARLPRVKGKALVLPSEAAKTPSKPTRLQIWGDTFPMTAAPGQSHVWHARFIEWLQRNFDAVYDDLGELPEDLEAAGRLFDPFEWKEPIAITEPGAAEVWEYYLAQYPERFGAWRRFEDANGPQSHLIPDMDTPDDSAQRKVAEQSLAYPHYWLIHFAAWVLDQSKRATDTLNHNRWRRPRVLEAALKARNDTTGVSMADYPPFNGQPAESGALQAFYDLLEDEFEKTAAENQLHDLDFFLRVMFTDEEPMVFSNRKRRHFEQIFSHFLSGLTDGRPLTAARWRESSLDVYDVWELLKYQGGLPRP